jgi:Spy/CpxP family protein refolding chaperone
MLALLCAPTFVAAQGRRSRGAPPDQSAPPRPTVAPVLWEPEQIFPLAIAHANDLHLTDQQRAQIETIGAQLRSRNARLQDEIDTLRPPPIERSDANGGAASVPPPLTPEQIAAVVARRHALGEARAQMHDNTRLARDQLIQLLTPEQATRMAALEASARTAAERGDPGGEQGGRRAGGKITPR